MEKSNGRTLLADEMGLGKTIQVLGVLFRNPEWMPAVVVCPASVKWNWEHEALKFGFRASICSSRSPPREGRWDLRSPIYIINYDILPYWVEWLKKQNVQTLVFDECQMLSSLTSKRLEGAKELARGVPHILGLSGSPFQNRSIEMFPILNLIWPKDFPSLMPYAYAYCDAKMVNGKIDYSGSSNLKMLNQRLIDLGMIRRKKEKVLNLPPKTRRMVPIEIVNHKEYQFAEANFLTWLKTTDPAKVRKASKVEDLARVGYLLRLCSKLKTNAVIHHINKFFKDNPGKKLVVMAVHRQMINHIMQNVHKKMILIDGTVTGETRYESIQQFQKDPQTVGAICNIKAGGLGVTLTAATTLMVVELWWNPAAHLQAEDRIHRIGQTQPVDIQYVVARNTIERRLCSILQRRQALANAVVDGLDKPDFTVYDELVSSLMKEGGFF